MTMTDTPTNGTSTRKLKTELVDISGELLDALPAEAQPAVLSLLSAIRQLPNGKRLEALDKIKRFFVKADSDPHGEALLADVIQFHRKELKR